MGATNWINDRYYEKRNFYEYVEQSINKSQKKEMGGVMGT